MQLAHIGEALAMFSPNASQGNSEGRRVVMDPTVLAYIAGFLDGDGSIFFQLVRRKDYRFGYQIRSSLSFYQKSENQRILHWLKSQLKCGSIRHRKTGISDYTIVEPKEVRRILRLLQPYTRLKQEHIVLGLQIIEGLQAVDGTADFLKLCRLVDRFKNLNYSKKRRNTTGQVENFLKSHHILAPVET